MSKIRIECEECNHVVEQPELDKAKIQHFEHFKAEHPDHRLVKEGRIDAKIRKLSQNTA